MIERKAYGLLMVAGLIWSSPWSPAGAYTTLHVSTLTASATIGTGSPLDILATPLPGQVFFGSNLVIPLQVTGGSSASGAPAARAAALNPEGLTVDIVYQLQDSMTTYPPNHVVASLHTGLNPNTLLGFVVVPRADLAAVSGGGTISYVLRARQAGVDTVLGGGPRPVQRFSTSPNGDSAALTNVPGVFNVFVTSITDHFCGPVSPLGSRVNAFDLAHSSAQTAGLTSVGLAPGAVASPGSLCIYAGDATRLPLGPGGSQPAAIYTVTLQDTVLVNPAELVLSYPADTNGRVLGVNADPGDLGIYFLDEKGGALAGGQWLPFTRSTLDSTLHTLSGTAAHLSTFALFPNGMIGSAQLRPAARIITPNGDGINDTASFNGLTSGDEIRIFDIRGRRIKAIRSAPWEWNGTDDSGAIVESGVYIYQYTSQGERTSGIIGVAK